jgi:hypothetical protein
MDFYRRQRIPLVIQKGSRSQRTFFVFVKLILRGPVDAESGMVLNLKLIDQAFAKLRSQSRVYKNFVHAALELSTFFKLEFDQLYWGLELSLRENRLIIENSVLFGQIKADLEIKEGQILTLRSSQLMFKGLSFAEAKKWLRLQNKKSREDILTAFSLNPSQLLVLKIEFPEWQGWENYSLHGFSSN